MKIALALLCLFAWLVVSVPVQGAESGRHTLPAGAWENDPGAYEVAPGHVVGIDRFVGDNDERMLLFSDYRTGTVRRLFAVSANEFEVGPGFGEPSPIAFRLRFIAPPGGRSAALTIERPGGRRTTAHRMTLSV